MALTLMVIETATPVAASVPGKPLMQTQCPGDSDSVARLYTAGLGPQPEKGGFEFWMEEYTSGNWTFPRMAQYFVESPEFQQSYGTLDDPTAEIEEFLRDRFGGESSLA